jgi:hypothetical protein
MYIDCGDCTETVEQHSMTRACTMVNAPDVAEC